MSTIITAIDRHSPAEKAGIQVGEQLLTINGHTIVDVLDYRFYGYDPLSRVELKTASGDVRTVTIRKAEGQDLGLNFDTYLMDEMRSCANHCIFCFVDQMPPGMRSTLYFKDDDARLSFLLGNYITLTNLTEREAQRIIDLHISPINVSVHTTDPQLHCTMLGNKNAERSLDYIQAFCKAGIVMNGQIVICPGWNDGDQLRRTLRDLTEWQFSSCSLVPVGITRYRQGLAKLRPVSAEDARDIIAIAEMTPGPIAVNSATFVGTKIAGIPGALVATAGCILPACILVTLIAKLYLKYRNIAVLQSVLGSLRPAVVAMIASAGGVILRNAFWSGAIRLSGTNWNMVALFAAAFLLLRRTKLSPILVMLLAGAANLVISLITP